MQAKISGLDILWMKLPMPINKSTIIRKGLLQRRDNTEAASMTAN
jgi:hypothetical protein